MFECVKKKKIVTNVRAMGVEFKNDLKTSR